MTVAATCRELAIACYENAQALCTEARLLLDHEHGARALALAILGLEEFAKAIVYALGTLRPADSEFLVEQRRSLRSHQVKHRILMYAEMAHIESADAVATWEEDADARNVSRYRTAVYLKDWFARYPMSKIVLGPEAAKTEFKTLKALAPEYLLDTELKDAAFYVDLHLQPGAPPEILRPNRIAHQAASNIWWLDWFLQTYAGLPALMQAELGP